MCILSSSLSGPRYQLRFSLAGSTILSIAYGLEVLPENDPYILAAEAGLCSLAKAAVPGAFLVDSIPPLKYIPGLSKSILKTVWLTKEGQSFSDWFPGSQCMICLPVVKLMVPRCNIQAQGEGVAAIFEDDERNAL